MIVLTGLMRSGSSAVARMLHQGGVLMGERELFPLPTDRHEWEDSDLQALLLPWFVEGVPPAETRQSCLTDYIERRQVSYSLMRRSTIPGHVVAWGFKTPLVAPFLTDLRSAATCLDEPLQLVLTHRDAASVAESLKRQVAHLIDPLRRETHARMSLIQDRVQASLACLPLEPLVKISLRETLGAREDVARRLCKALDLKMDVTQMVRGIDAS